MVPQLIAQEILQMQADVCAALAAPARILLLRTLNEKPSGVGELSRDLHLNQSTVSRHLRILRELGLVTTVHKAANVQYAVADQRLIQILDIVNSIVHDRVTYRASLMDRVGGE
jgi:DNA-binding transcriptional ArsR family regulator